LGDGLFVYFGYPQAHEDDAQSAIQAGLGIFNAIENLNRPKSKRQIMGLRAATSLARL
jgi:class 3 adenylate cyclase